jgi:hypothetical protein
LLSIRRQMPALLHAMVDTTLADVFY